MSLVKCQFDPFLQSLRATVVSCSPSLQSLRNANEKDDKAGGGSINGCKGAEVKSKDGDGKEKSNKSKQNGCCDEQCHSAECKANGFDVILSDTILFPEGGGQPSDEGTIGGVKVSYVYRGKDGRVVHCCEGPFKIGSEVEVKVDWKRRFDHMQQHSAQHLTSAVASALFSMETKSWWLAKHPNECHIEFATKSISPEVVRQLQAAVNERIRAGLTMRARIFENAEQALKDPAFRLRAGEKAIPDAPEGQLRVVEIEGLDFNTCCGTHVTSTTQIQLVVFTGTQSSRGNTRLMFLAGDRAIGAFDRMNTTEKQIAPLLSTGPEGFVDAISKIQGEMRTQSKLQKNLYNELADLHAEKLLSQTKKTRSYANISDLRVKYRLWLSEKPQVPKVTSFHHEDSSFPLASLADALQARQPDILALLTCGNTASEGGQFLLAGPAEKVDTIGNDIARLLGGKGGGRKGRFQGKFGKIDSLEPVLKFLHDQ